MLSQALALCNAACAEEGTAKIADVGMLRRQASELITAQARPRLGFTRRCLHSWLVGSATAQASMLACGCGPACRGPAQGFMSDC